MSCLFTICGRAGSKGFKNKNLKEMNGVPLVFYALASIRLFAEEHEDEDITVALNTDSQQLQKIVEDQRFVDVTCVERKTELAGDRVGKVNVVRDTYNQLKSKKTYDVVVDLDITSPLRTADDIDNAISEYRSNRDYELVVSVVEARRSPYFNMVEKKGDCYRKICDSDYVARQEAPQSYELNASIYVYDPMYLESESNKTILDSHFGISVMRDYLVLDIDSEEDFRMMEFLHRYYCEQDDGLKSVFELAGKM